MKTKLLFALFTLLNVACGNKVAQPEPTKEDNISINLPEYKLLSIEEPNVSSKGYIPSGQNLIYNIEIDYPLQNDSLELLQNYFIQKGEADFAGINKIIVRAYLKGTSRYGIPYASLNYIGVDKEIIINEDAKEIEAYIEESSTETVCEVANPIVGTYFCNRTHDTYVFKSDNTGFFNIQGGTPSVFTWKRSGNNVAIMYENSDEQKLKYDPSAETLTEKSELFGTLVFYKQ